MPGERRRGREDLHIMRDYVTFILNGKTEVVRDLSPSTTLLEFLRKSRRLTGTKEGCAEGDCGACTVVIGELGGQSVRYCAVNACILLMPMLEGRSVWTIEGVRIAQGQLHPAQQAMVDHHGSQCGFCTPGFVMSLFATYISQSRPDTTRINDILAGNLCRCTGYGPIVKAAHAMYDLPSVAMPEEARQLAGIAHSETTLLQGDGTRCFLPTTVDALAELAAAHPDAVIVAGATDVGLWITKQHRRITTFISTARIHELRRIVRDGNMLRIGAAATWSELEHPIDAIYPEFGELLRRFASVQVRNSATIGGNIANGSPIGDGPPALIALGANLVLRKGAATRTLPLEDFFVAYGKQDRAPGELVIGIELPVIPDPSRFKAYKISKRFDQDISAVCGCFNIQVVGGIVVGARIAFGGMAATPKRALTVEAALLGKPWTEASITAALPVFEADFAPITDMRSSAAYRMQVAKNLLRRYFHETQHSLAETRLVGRSAAFA